MRGWSSGALDEGWPAAAPVPGGLRAAEPHCVLRGLCRAGARPSSRETNLAVGTCVTF